MYNLILIIQVLNGTPKETTHTQVFQTLKECNRAAAVMAMQPRVKKAFCRGVK